MTNKTQCPNCLTVYIITDEQYEKSKGKVRCGTCRQPFVADFLPNTQDQADNRFSIKSPNRRDSPRVLNRSDSLPKAEKAPREDRQEASSEIESDNAESLADEAYSQSAKSVFEESLSESSRADLDREKSKEEGVSSVEYSFGFEENLHSELNIERDKQPEKVQRQRAAELIGQVDELIDEKLITNGDYKGAQDSGEVGDQFEGFQVGEEGFPEGSLFAEGSLLAEGSSFAEGSLLAEGSSSAEGSQSADGSSSGDELLLDQPFTLDQRSPLNKVLTWFFAPILVLGIVAMLALLVYQLWLRQAVPILDNERVAQTLEPYTSVVKEKVDELLGWQIPVRRDLANLRLVSARVEPHPDRPSTTLLKVSISNKSTIAQPFPWLELVLTDENGRLVARRTLPPTDYIHNNRLRAVVRANELRQVTIELLAFPRQAHGYELKILNQ